MLQDVRGHQPYRGAVPRSPFALAALATLAVPGLDGRQVAPLDSAAEGFDSAVVVDAEQSRWIVRAPATAAAGAALEAEVAFLEAVEPYVGSGDLSFVVPHPAGFAPLPDGGRAVVHAELPGHPLVVDRLAPGPGLAASVGRAIAAIHELPVSIVEHTGHPAYSAEEYRTRRLAEVDDAALTGRVPVTLLRRWEDKLGDVAMWRFQPTITHSNLSAEALLTQAGSVSAVQDWSQVRVADPADDLAWLLAAAPAESLDTIMEAYQLRRTELLDPHLTDRALLASELALVRWLLHGVHNDLPDVIEDAVGMLYDLDVATAAADGELVELPAYGYRGPRPADDVSTTALSLTDDEPFAPEESPDTDPGAVPATTVDESEIETNRVARVTPGTRSGDGSADADDVPTAALSLPADDTAAAGDAVDTVGESTVGESTGSESTGSGDMGRDDTGTVDTAADVRDPKGAADYPEDATPDAVPEEAAGAGAEYAPDENADRTSSSS